MPATSLNIDTVWTRILNQAGQPFHTVTGIEFTYEAHGGGIKLLNTNQKLPRSNFEEALGMWPIQNTSQIQHLRGPSYTLAILRDARITGGA